MSSRRITRSVAVVLVGVLAATSCSTGVSKPSGRVGAGSSKTTVARPATGRAGVALLRTPAEKHFGLAPTPSKDVTYADDVVLLPDGPESIVSVANSGAAVVLKPDAPGVDAVAKGKILFATGRVVGRVAGVRTTAEGVEVGLLPVALTEVVEKANLSWDQPVDPSSMLVYEGQNLGGNSTDAKADVDVPDGSELLATTDADGNTVEEPSDADDPHRPRRPTGTANRRHPLDGTPTPSRSRTKRRRSAPTTRMRPRPRPQAVRAA